MDPETAAGDSDSQTWTPTNSWDQTDGVYSLAQFIKPPIIGGVQEEGVWKG